MCIFLCWFSLFYLFLNNLLFNLLLILIISVFIFPILIISLLNKLELLIFVVMIFIFIELVIFLFSILKFVKIALLLLSHLFSLLIENQVFSSAYLFKNKCRNFILVDFFTINGNLIII